MLWDSTAGANIHSTTLTLASSPIPVTHIIFKLTRTFVIAAVVSSSVLCAPIPQGAGKPIGAGQVADPSAPAINVFGTTPQDPNYHSHPTGLCIVPALAKDAGLSQGGERLAVQQAIQLCSKASTIAVSYKRSKRSTNAPNNAPPRLVHSPIPEPHPNAPHPVRCSSSLMPHVASHLSLTSLLLPPLPPSPAPQPHPDAHPIGARSDAGKPPKDGIPPRPFPEPLPDAPQPHIARDLPPHPAPEPQPLPVPVPGSHPVAARGEGKPHPDPQAPPQAEPRPEPQPGAPHPVAARSAPKAEVPPHGQPLPATVPRPFPN
ncbi:hypothetical protein OPQ81_001025 [Rhizoctonia solani]|nr:hypothetical protein OPQ81_001025 [Rhizoctonia solani]